MITPLSRAHLGTLCCMYSICRFLSSFQKSISSINFKDRVQLRQTENSWQYLQWICRDLPLTEQQLFRNQGWIGTLLRSEYSRSSAAVHQYVCSLCISSMHQSISRDSAAQFKFVILNRLKEVWVESQTLNGVISTQVAHLLSQQQPGDDTKK